MDNDCYMTIGGKGHALLANDVNLQEYFAVRYHKVVRQGAPGTVVGSERWVNYRIPLYSVAVIIRPSVRPLMIWQTKPVY